MSCAREVPRPELGAAYENVEFTTSDGLKLKGWYIPSKNGAAVISFPGRSGTQNEARMLVRHGYGVLLFDRRGEGESEGDPNAFGWQGERDIHAAVAYLQRRSDVDPARIGGIGLSVGGEMMIEAAAESSALKAIVSEGASGRSVRDIIANPGGHGRKCSETACHGRDRALHEQPAAARPEEPRAEDRAARGVLRLRRTGSGGRGAANRGFYEEAREPKQIWEVPDGRTHRRARGAAGGVRAARDRRSSTTAPSAGEVVTEAIDCAGTAT